MCNIEITMNMVAPVAVSGYLYLDGILAAAIMKEKLRDDYYDKKPNQTELIEIPLPLEKQYGVWCGSVGFGDNKECVSSWAKRWDSENDDVVKFNGKGMHRIDISAGYFKNYHMPLITKSFKQITFYAKGDIKEAERLLKKYIFYIGKKAAQGYGEIKNIEFKEIDQDYSCFKDGAPTRPIPVENYPEYEKKCIDNNLPFNVSLHVASPPYWRTDNLVQCYMPT